MLDWILFGALAVPFVGTLLYLLFKPRAEKTDVFFNASCRNTCEDAIAIFKRAISDEDGRPDYLGQKRNEQKKA